MFEHLGIVYFIGGSVSSSVHGTARHTYDVDIIAQVSPDQVHALVQALQDDYYVDEEAWRDAVRHGISYGLLYLQTITKVDVMPFQQRAFTREEERRAEPYIFEDDTPPIRIASAEDIVLSKLEWFQQGGRSSTRQWDDILGVLRQRRGTLDMHYLHRWANTLGVQDLLEQALRDAELTEP